jgi:ribosome-associated protein
MLEVNATVQIPESELSYRTSPSSGPGGQNVNKVETRVTVYFHLAASKALSDEQRALVLARLATRIDKHGILRVVSQKHRTQRANREEARLRLARLIAGAIEPRRPRRKTRKPAAANRRRLDDKRRRSDLKRLRKAPED